MHIALLLVLAVAPTVPAESVKCARCADVGQVLAPIVAASYDACFDPGFAQPTRTATFRLDLAKDGAVSGEADRAWEPERRAGQMRREGATRDEVAGIEQRCAHPAGAPVRTGAANAGGSDPRPARPLPCARLLGRGVAQLQDRAVRRHPRRVPRRQS